MRHLASIETPDSQQEIYLGKPWGQSPVLDLGPPEFLQGVDNMLDTDTAGPHTNQHQGHELGSQILPSPKEVVVIHGYTEGLIKATHPVKIFAAGKSRLVRNPVDPAKFLPAPRMSANLAQRYWLGMFFPGQAYHLAIYHISILVPHQMGRHGLEPRRLQQEVIGIQIKDPISLRLRQSQVESMGDAPIRPAMPICQTGLVPADDLYRPISRTTVDNNVLYQRVALRQNTLNRLLNKLFPIQANGYY